MTIFVRTALVFFIILAPFAIFISSVIDQALKAAEIRLSYPTAIDAPYNLFLPFSFGINSDGLKISVWSLKFISCCL